MGKKIIASVISDLVTDQRVLKECLTFHKQGYEVLLIGRQSQNSLKVDNMPFRCIRLRDPFKRGLMMYAFFNIQLFFHLVFRHADILWSNDLDTLLPNYVVSKLQRIKLVYDSHEYFLLTVAKKASRIVFSCIEKFVFPRLKNVITVNDSIKKVYQEQYGVPVCVIRNVPFKENIYNDVTIRADHAGKKILLMQGIGLNEHRGCEQAVETMQFLDDSFILYFIGSGTMLNKLKALVQGLGLTTKVFFLGILSYNEMMAYTKQAFLGLIFEDIYYNDEHKFSLPNKFFDYIKAGLPVLTTRAVEIEIIVEHYNIGDFIENLIPENIASSIKKIERNQMEYIKWKQNLPLAASELNWELEELKIIDFLNHLK